MRRFQPGPCAAVLILLLAIAFAAPAQAGPSDALQDIVNGLLQGLLEEALGGALPGSGPRLTARDRDILAQARQDALEFAPADGLAGWENPRTGHSGIVVPGPTYRVPSGRLCRDFSETTVMGGRSRQAYGTGCRWPDGVWRPAR